MTDNDFLTALKVQTYDTEDAMGNFHRMERQRLVAAFAEERAYLESRIIYKGIVNDELTEANADFRRDIANHRRGNRYLWLALFGCSIVIVSLWNAAVTKCQ